MPVSLRPRPLASLPTERLSTGCPHLDAALSGGLPVGSLTEVAGEAAASKTQLSLQLLLTAQLPHEAGGLGGSAVYIYTEGEPPLRRLHQLAQALPLRYAPKVLAGLPYPASNVFVEKSVANGADLLARVQRLRPLLERQRRAAAAAGGGATLGGAAAGSSNSGSGIAARPVRLLVIDSVAHVFRDLGETGGGVGELAGRTELLFRMSTLLRRLADEFSLAVLLVNQVVDAVTDEAAPTSSGMQLSSSSAARHAALTGGLRLVSLGREVVPALGLAWANCVNTRLFLARCGAAGLQAVFHGAPSAAAAAAAAAAAGGSGGASAPALRKLQVLFSPHLPQTECHYVVEATGVRGLHPAEVDQHDAAAAAAAWEAAQQEAQERRAWQATQQQQHWQEQQQEQCQPPPQQHQQGQWQQQQGQQQVRWEQDQQQWHQGQQQAPQHAEQMQQQQHWPQQPLQQHWPEPSHQHAWRQGPSQALQRPAQHQRQWQQEQEQQWQHPPPQDQRQQRHRPAHAGRCEPQAAPAPRQPLQPHHQHHQQRSW